jgi:hydrogenase nickel incorporation protein HypA/HybF
MHELAIAESVKEIVVRHAQGSRVTSVQLRVGHLRQVVPSALTFAFDLVTAGSVAEGAELEIEDVPTAGMCRCCDAPTELRDFPLGCERCGGLDVEITSGEELVVDSLELAEQEPVTSESSRMNEAM